MHQIIDSNSWEILAFYIIYSCILILYNLHWIAFILNLHRWDYTIYIFLQLVLFINTGMIWTFYHVSKYRSNSTFFFGYLNISFNDHVSSMGIKVIFLFLPLHVVPQFICIFRTIVSLIGKKFLEVEMLNGRYWVCSAVKDTAKVLLKAFIILP